MAKAHTLTDNFNDNTVDTGLWSIRNGLAEINGRIESTPPGNVSHSWSEITSEFAYDLTDSYVYLEVIRPLNAVPGSRTYLELKDGGDHNTKVTFYCSEGTLAAHQEIDGDEIALAVVPYDAAAHRWWRIGERGGITLWDVSRDGVHWVPFCRRLNPIDLTQIVVNIGGGSVEPIAGQGTAVFDNVNVLPGVAVPLPDRSCEALRLRVHAATRADRGPVTHRNNGEEGDYPYVANFSKGLQHDANGDVIPASYQSLLAALATRAPNDFEAILLGPGGKKLTNPQAGLAFTLEGPDPAAVTQPPAPRIDSPQNSAEMGELYWMALARDVHFADYGSSTVVQQAIQSLNTDFSDFRGPRQGGAVTTQTVFRGVFPGETVGPYLSQFLLKGNSDPRVPDNSGLGRRTFEGLITYGDLKIDQRQLTVVPGMDYLTDYGSWLDAQNGWDFRGMDVLDGSQRRFIRNLRDLGERVHIDNVGDMFFNACLILLHEPPGNQIAGGGVIGRDMEFVWDQGNPYLAYAKQAPFATLGSAHALSLVWEALIRALRAVWLQKWFVHRRLRPEEFGGRIHNHLTAQRTYPQIDGEILASLTAGGLAPYFGNAGDAFPTYLLPQAYAEGAPTHPAYGAGHATGAGACTTVLKALFNESSDIQAPMIANADGTALEFYTGPGADQMTLGGELNKLAGNIAYGRNAAGVHWRSDADQSLLLGEQIAIALLQEQSLLLNEPEFYLVTKFDGITIRIQDGTVTVI